MIGSEFNQALAETLARLRRERHSSQGTLAAELNIDQAAVSRVESGRRHLSVAEAFAWLEALGHSPDESAKILHGLWLTHGRRPPGFWEDG